MMARSSAGFRPGLKSTSQPRSAKISTARGLSSSEMRTLGFAMFSLDFGVSPIQPRQQRFQIALLDSGTAPDAQTRRGIAIAADVVAGLLAFQQVGHLLGRRGLLVGRQS